MLFTFGTDDKTEASEATAVAHRLQRNTDDRGREQRERDIESC